ncbi:MAG: Fic family protein [Proteobacteria bacterium]|nr:Fic family protein [Pseudomonadota bacterium]MBU4277339.1 Fic family protein [Pseudomonadota bacterium]MBU4382423.1 Fic family protein [Pseudomonadota bacterium]MBU4606885.1 Fic family protein [Pseudomonadota bacterium]MCG2763992.1 Fic family protein [Desulfarculaceae bacterium]
MDRKIQGNIISCSVAGEKYQAYVPAPLPPKPPIKLSPDLDGLLEKSLLALGRLDSISTLLPDTRLFIYMYVRKEAVLSSQIEGTQSSLSDLLLYESEELPGFPLDEVQEVSNYIAAMNHGIKRLREGFPLSLRLIKEIHGVLLDKGRGSEKDPGEFRRSQNWIGGSRPGNAVFVPPPPEKVIECMGNLEKFLHDDPVRTTVLVKAALTHVQFETIHPFLDGNGRLGRLLITLLLCAEGILEEPLLYLSLYFKANRDNYYDLLQKVRISGNWETWLKFFLEGIKETAENAVTTARRLVSLFAEDKEAMQDKLGRAASSAIRVHSVLQESPMNSVSKLSLKTGLSAPAVTNALKNLENLGIITEITGRSYGRVYAYSKYIAILGEGT